MGGWSAQRTGRFNPGIRSPDRPPRSQSLHRLSYPGPHILQCGHLKQLTQQSSTSGIPRLKFYLQLVVHYVKFINLTLFIPLCNVIHINTQCSVQCSIAILMLYVSIETDHHRAFSTNMICVMLQRPHK
jgi:hypothetical protein